MSRPCALSPPLAPPHALPYRRAWRACMGWQGARPAHGVLAPCRAKGTRAAMPRLPGNRPYSAAGSARPYPPAWGRIAPSGPVSAAARAGPARSRPSGAMRRGGVAPKPAHYARALCPRTMPARYARALCPRAMPARKAPRIRASPRRAPRKPQNQKSN